MSRKYTLRALQENIHFAPNLQKDYHIFLQKLTIFAVYWKTPKHLWYTVVQGTHYNSIPQVFWCLSIHIYIYILALIFTQELQYCAPCAIFVLPVLGIFCLLLFCLLFLFICLFVFVVILLPCFHLKHRTYKSSCLYSQHSNMRFESCAKEIPRLAEET